MCCLAVDAANKRGNSIVLTTPVCVVLLSPFRGFVSRGALVPVGHNFPTLSFLRHRPFFLRYAYVIRRHAMRLGMCTARGVPPWWGAMQ